MCRISFRKSAIIYNFIGEWIDGYEQPCALLTKEAAGALKAVSSEMFVQGYRLKVFDAYRPTCAVRHFVLWGNEDKDTRMKEYFYPSMEKQEIFSRGYIASQSSHNRGSAVDLTLLDMKTGKELDMGSPFDLFSEISHPDYRGITEEQFENRMILQKAMLRSGSGYLGSRPIHAEYRPVREAQFHKFSICLKLEAYLVFHIHTSKYVHDVNSFVK